MGSKPRSGEEYVSRLVIEKERVIYWLCSLLERDGPATRDGARRALAELGYDERRIRSMLLLGEPGLRAGEQLAAALRRYDVGKGERAAGGCWSGEGERAAGNSWSGRSCGTDARLHGRLMVHGSGNG